MAKEIVRITNGRNRTKPMLKDVWERTKDRPSLKGYRLATVDEIAREQGLTGEEVEITDAARKLADENGIDVTTIEGSGEGGNIVKPDVEKAVEAKAAKAKK